MMNTSLATERVTQAAQDRPGHVTEVTFWIAYPRHVGTYGQVNDRISFATGKGKTKAEALKNAQRA